MEIGTLELNLLEDNTTVKMHRLFSYIKKKDVDGRDMMLLSCKDLDYVKLVKNYKGILSVKGRTLSNKKYPEGLYFSSVASYVVRAQTRLGYTEYLLVCDDKIYEK